MPTQTTYKKLTKPLSTEKYNVDVVNKNNDIIDSELHKFDLKNEEQDKLLATKESLLTEQTRATNKEDEIADNLKKEITRARDSESTIKNNLNIEIERATTKENNIKEILTEHIENESNPHKVTKEQLGLENVDNTSDMSKPVSIPQREFIEKNIGSSLGSFAYDDIPKPNGTGSSGIGIAYARGDHEHPLQSTLNGWSIYETPLTQEEYNALPEETKNAEKVLFVIK